jgi:hypothetical protein
MWPDCYNYSYILEQKQLNMSMQNTALVMVSLLKHSNSELDEQHFDSL